MADFPPDGVKEDSSFHTETREDNIIRHKSESGIEVTRPRTTRRPPRMFTTGLTHLTTAQKELVDAFMEAYQYGALSFSYNIPSKEVGVTEEIRVKMQGQLVWEYKGVGPTRIWNSAEIALREDY